MKNFLPLILLIFFVPINSQTYSETNLHTTKNPTHTKREYYSWSDNIYEIQVHKNWIDVFIDRPVILRKYSMQVDLAYLIDNKGKKYKLTSQFEKINNEWIQQEVDVYIERVRKKNSRVDFCYRFEKIDPGVEQVSIMWDEDAPYGDGLPKYNIWFSDVSFKNPSNKLDFEFPKNSGYSLATLKQYLYHESNDPLEGIYKIQFPGGGTTEIAFIRGVNDKYIEISLSGYKKEYIDPNSCARLLSRNVQFGDIDGYLEKSNGASVNWYTYSNNFLDVTGKKLSMDNYLILFNDFTYKEGNSVNVTKYPQQSSLYADCDVLEIVNRELQTTFLIEKTYPLKDYPMNQSPANDLKKESIKTPSKPKKKPEQPKNKLKPQTDPPKRGVKIGK